MTIKTNSKTKRLATAGIAALSGLALAIGPGAAPASADATCEFYNVVTNENDGGEAPENRLGHRHGDDAHYVKNDLGGGRYEIWADNNGGLDGDTQDTFHGYVHC